MNPKGESVGYVSIATVAILATVVFTCASVIPMVKALDYVPGLAYYANEGSNFIRSATPFAFATADYDFLQSVTASGGIITTLTPLPGGTGGYADLGFGYTFGKLGDIASIPIVGIGTYAINIYIDMNTANDIGGNGPFFSWSGDTFNGLDGDEYGLGPQITGSGAITPVDSFSLVAHGYSTYTIAQLQAGAVAGIDGNTIVGFWFGITYQMNPQFEIDLINGEPVVCVSPPVGGEWVPVGTIQMLIQLVGYSAAMSAVIASFVGLKRLRKKQN